MGVGGVGLCYSLCTLPCSAYHGHLKSLKILSTYRLAKTGLEDKSTPSVCIVSVSLFSYVALKH